MKKSNSAKKWILSSIAIMAFGLSSTGATCNTSQAVTVTTDIAGEVICVLQHDTQPPAQIVVACAGLALGDVNNILAADTNSAKWRGADAGAL